MHGLIFETSVCYWQNQPGCYLFVVITRVKDSSHYQNKPKFALITKPHPQHEESTQTEIINMNEVHQQTDVNPFLDLFIKSQSYRFPTPITVTHRPEKYHS